MRKIIKEFLLSFFLVSCCLYSCNNSPKKFTVTWKNYDDTILEVDKDVIEGSIPSYDGNTPTKPNTDDFIYSFNGWSPEIAPVKENVTYKATFKVYKTFYKITFVNDDGELLQEEMVKYGTIPTYKKDLPKAKKTSKIGYKTKFKKWNKELVKVTCDKTYKAVYSTNDLDLLEMPVITINTDDGLPIESKEKYKHSSITIQNTDEEYCMTNVAANVRGRGNSSWTDFDKKPYRIKFDKKTSLFGTSYNAKSWTLIANYSDKSLFRNYIAYEISKKIGGLSFSSVHIPVELYLNNEYLGVYLLCDQVETGKGRVDIDETIDTNTGNNGYLFELDYRAPREGTLDIDYFMGSDNYLYTIKTPDTSSKEYLSVKDLEISYIKTYFNSCLSTLESGTWDEISNLMDINSFVSGYVIQELFANTDCHRASVYYYKDKDGKLFNGPVWDFDIGAGNSNYGPGTTESCPPNISLYVADKNTIYKKFYQRQEFKTLVHNKLISFQPLFNEIMELINIENENSLYKNNKESLNRNFDKWKIMGTYVWPNPKDVYEIDTVDGQIAFLRNWLIERYSYLLSKF